MSNGTKLQSEMTPDEELASIKSFSRTIEGLDDAIDLLNARKANFATSEAELKLVKIKLADLKADLAKVRARFIAFDAGQHSMKPPTQPTLQKIISLSGELDKMVANAQTADAIVAAGVALAKEWEKTQAA